MTRRGPVVVRARRRATACLDFKRQAPLLGSLQLVHATSQISYLLIQCRHPSTRKDTFQRHQERAEPTHDCETACCRSRSNKKHQRGKGKQAGGQCQDNVARQCCDQDWKQEKGERGNAETLQKLTQVFDMPIHYTILRLDAAEHSILDAAGAAPREGYSLSQANSSASRLSSRIAAALDGQREPDVA